MDVENQRRSFRVESLMEGELFHEGRVVACAVENLSAGGAAVVSSLEMPAGTQCTLGLRLADDLAVSSGLEYVSFHMEVLEVEAIRGGDLRYRMRNLTSEGSAAYERAQRVVFEAQRRELAARSGADESSPLVSDRDRRRRLRRPRRPRFGKGSLRPGHGDDS
jgi:hypothetical protein